MGACLITAFGTLTVYKNDKEICFTSRYTESQCKIKYIVFNLSLLLLSDSFYLLSTYCAETWAGVGLLFVLENIIFVYLSCFNLLGWNWEPISSAFTSDLIRRCNSLKQECQLRWLSLMKLCHSQRAHVQKRIWIMLAGKLDITGEF